MRFLDDVVDVWGVLDSLAHAQAEVAEPLVIKPDGPVFAQELHHVRDDASLVPLGQLVEVVLVESDETPERLQHDLFVAHVGNRVNQADTVERKLDEMTFSG